MIRRLAVTLAGLRGWKRFALAFLLGVLAAGAFPPLYLLPLLFVAFPGMLWLLDGVRGPRNAFLIGWFFGWGHFIAGLYWIGFAFFVDAAAHAALLPLPVLGLPAALAVFPGLVFLMVHLSRQRGGRRVLALALLWTAFEYLRGQLFTGFPWNLIGHAWAFSDVMMQPAAWVGVYGMSLFTVALAALPALFADPGTPLSRARKLAGGGALAFMVLFAAAAWRLSSAEVGYFPDVRLRIVQANIEQSQKWVPDKRLGHVEKQIEMTRRAGFEAVTLVIWPETAVPFFMEQSLGLRQLLSGIAPPGGAFITGVPRRNDGKGDALRLWNSVQALSPTGEVVATYDKKHLVPFGEYLPLRDLLGLVGLDKLAAGAVDFSHGTGSRLIAVPGLPAAAGLICYEAIFADEIPTGAERPEWLLNVTNDAWFGMSNGPYQHLAMSRFRSVEQGLAMVRAANTGVSAVIDPYGRVLASLGLGRAGVLDSVLPRPLAAPTLYARFGDCIFLVIMLAGLGALFLPAFRRKVR